MKLPHDLFRHTMRFQNPQTKTGEIIEELITTHTVIQEAYHEVHPSQNKNTTDESCMVWGQWAANNLSVNCRKYDIFFQWALRQYPHLYEWYYFN